MKLMPRLVTKGGRLKELQGRRKSLSIELKHCFDFKLSKKLQSELRQTDNLIARLTAEPVITEHAILRYLERVKGIDIKAIEREMLEGDMLIRINTFGIGEAKVPHPTHKGVRLVIQDKTVITVEC